MMELSKGDPLYGNGVIVTDADDKYVLREEFCEALAEVLVQYDDIDFEKDQLREHLRYWIIPYSELCCAVRGYKAGATKIVTHRSGHYPQPDQRETLARVGEPFDPDLLRAAGQRNTDGVVYAGPHARAEGISE